MGLTIDEFRTLVKGMKAVYVYDNFIPDNDSFKVWYQLLHDIDYDVLSMAIQRHMQTSNKIPTVADLRANVSHFISSGSNTGMSDLEAWHMVRKAIGNSGYHQQEEFDNLPQIIQKAVGTSSQLHQWCMMDTETVDSVIQSQFLRSYRAVVKRAEEDSHVSPILLEKIEQARQQAAIGTSKPETPVLEDKPVERASAEHIDELLKKFRQN